MEQDRFNQIVGAVLRLRLGDECNTQAELKYNLYHVVKGLALRTGASGDEATEFATKVSNDVRRAID